MSQENVEIVARSIDAFNDAFNRGDLEGFLEFVTPDIE
jgi:ketosteroid isomerase-like protein